MLYVVVCSSVSAFCVMCFFFFFFFKGPAPPQFLPFSPPRPFPVLPPPTFPLPAGGWGSPKNLPATTPPPAGARPNAAATLVPCQPDNDSTRARLTPPLAPLDC